MIILSTQLETYRKIVISIYIYIYIKLMCPLEIQMSHSQIRSAKQISTLVAHLAGVEKIMIKQLL